MEKNYAKESMKIVYEAILKRGNTLISMPKTVFVAGNTKDTGRASRIKENNVHQIILMRAIGDADDSMLFSTIFESVREQARIRHDYLLSCEHVDPFALDESNNFFGILDCVTEEIHSHMSRGVL